MASVRLDPELESQLDEAARRLGESKSEFIRRALSDRVEEVQRSGLDWDALWAKIDAIELPDHVPYEELDEWSQYLYRKHIGNPDEVERRRRSRIADSD
jgi:predicted transcriptional regulator